MYAKLYVGASNANLYQCLRDIARLLTSSSPSLSDLSGSGFSASTSTIVDATPAGWTYVGSTKATDQPTIGAGSADATFSTTVWNNWCLSAPMAGDSSKLKYAMLRQQTQGTTSPAMYLFALLGAQTLSSTGVETNRGYRTSGTLAQQQAGSLETTAGTILHVVATQRHITIVQEGKGVMAIWETTNTDAHTFYGAPAFVQYNHPTSSTTTIQTTDGSTAIICANAFNVTDVNTSTVTGVAELSAGGSLNIATLVQNQSASRANAIDASGFPKYQISPVFLQMTTQGYPVQYVTGVVPVYWCKAGLGTTGDTVNIGGDYYTYFNCGASGGTFGLLMKTS